MTSNFIQFSIVSDTGIINLNRPKVLNALNLEMAQQFYKKIREWNSDSQIKRVLLKGEGKSLCTGGDIKSLYFSSNKNKLKKKFFQVEYKLNNTINEFTKPYLSLWNGLVMGGGVGLSIYGNCRLVSDTTKFAMPETAIGFFPDVGASHFLSKLDNGIGLFLGLTGKICNAKDLMVFGLATHYLPQNMINKTIENYISGKECINGNHFPTLASDILDNRNFIEDTFIGNIQSIMKKLKNSALPFAKKIYDHLLTRCPMSLAVTTELLHKAKSKNLKKCLKMEYQLCQKMVYRKDFNNGVDAVLVSKTNSPIWSPSSIYDINVDEVKKLFHPHIKELEF